MEKEILAVLDAMAELLSSINHRLDVVQDSVESYTGVVRDTELLVKMEESLDEVRRIVKRNET